MRDKAICSSLPATSTLPTHIYTSPTASQIVAHHSIGLSSSMKSWSLTSCASSCLSQFGWNCSSQPSMKSRTPENVVVVGLVGGIATGKSTVLDYLGSKGATLINADKLGHESYLPGTKCFKQLVAHFGEEIVGEDGMINRKALGGKVYNDPAQMDALNGIVWPAIRALMDARVQQKAEEIGMAQGDAFSVKNVIVVEAAVLIEAKWFDLVDEVWMTFTDRELQKRRLMARNKISEEDAESRLAAQLSNEERRAYAHVVIENNGEVEELNKNVEEAVERLETRYRKLSAFEILDVVKDKHGIDHAKRAVIVNFGLTTRCSYVVLSQASSGKYFVQKRSALKDSYPSMLDPAPGGHCDRGESFKDCAAREIREEMGVDVAGKLQFVGNISVFEGYGVEGEIFAATLDCEIEDLNVDESEVAGVLLKSYEEILAAPEAEYIPDGLIAFKEYAKTQGNMLAQTPSSI